MNKNLVKIIGIILLILIIIFYISVGDFTPNSDRDKIFLEKIEKLESKIDSINIRKDSIRDIIDSTHIKIITNEKHYQEVINNIISQPTNSDYVFITGYIRQHRSKRDSNNIR